MGTTGGATGWGFGRWRDPRRTAFVHGHGRGRRRAGRRDQTLPWGSGSVGQPWASQVGSRGRRGAGGRPRATPETGGSRGGRMTEIATRTEAFSLVADG